MQGWFPFKEPVVLLLRIMGLSERSPKKNPLAGPRRVRFSAGIRQAPASAIR